MHTGYRLSDFRCIAGASFRMVVDLADPDRSICVNAPGQSGDPRSPHYGDLAPLGRTALTSRCPSRGGGGQGGGGAHQAGAGAKAPLEFAMRITTWNVNSVRQRLDHLLAFLKEAEPDVLCLQEIKTQDEGFPRLEVEAAGYHVETHGQKTFNGVAILSKSRLEDVRRGLPGDPSDEQARYIEGLVPFGSGMARVASIYLPNGNPPDTEKYAYKLAWMDRLIAHAIELMKLEEPLVLAGDYNVIPEPRDCHDPAAWAGDALFLPRRARSSASLSAPA